MQKLKGLAQFAISNFGPIAIFYVGNHFWGLKAAVTATAVWSISEIIIYKIRKKKMSPFFLFCAAITVLFGLIDIYLQQSVLFKYEAAMTSALVGFYFASSLFGKKTLIQEFAEAQGRITQPPSPDGIYYFKFITILWVIYQWVKAIAYAWFAANYSIEKALLLRGTVGNISFYGMLFISIFGAKHIKAVLFKLRLLPSSRGNNEIFS